MQKIIQPELWEENVPAQIRWEQLPAENCQQAVELLTKMLIDHSSKKSKKQKGMQNE